MDILQKLNDNIYDLELEIKDKETKMNNLVNQNFSEIQKEFEVKFDYYKLENSLLERENTELIKEINKLKKSSKNSEIILNKEYENNLKILEESIIQLGRTNELLQEEVEEKDKQIKKLSDIKTIQDELNLIHNTLNIILDNINDKRKWWLW